MQQNTTRQHSVLDTKSFFVTAEDRLLALNKHHDRLVEIENACLDVTDDGDPTDPRVASYVATIHQSLRERAKLRCDAIAISPTTLVGLGLKARLLTDVEDPAEIDVELLLSLVGNLLSSAGLSGVTQFASGAERLLADAAAGKTFYSADELSRQHLSEGAAS